MSIYFKIWVIIIIGSVHFSIRKKKNQRGKIKILVTGCAGFIGSLLTDCLLNQGHTVFGVDCFTDYYPRYAKEKNLQSAKQSPNFILIEKNINYLDDFPLVDIVFHEALRRAFADPGANPLNHMYIIISAPPNTFLNITKKKD